MSRGSKAENLEYIGDIRVGRAIYEIDWPFEEPPGEVKSLREYFIHIYRKDTGEYLDSCDVDVPQGKNRPDTIEDILRQAKNYIAEGVENAHL